MKIRIDVYQGDRIAGFSLTKPFRFIIMKHLHMEARPGQFCQKSHLGRAALFLAGTPRPDEEKRQILFDTWAPHEWLVKRLGVEETKLGMRRRKE